MVALEPQCKLKSLDVCADILDPGLDPWIRDRVHGVPAFRLWTVRWGMVRESLASRFEDYRAARLAVSEKAQHAPEHPGWWWYEETSPVVVDVPTGRTGSRCKMAVPRSLSTPRCSSRTEVKSARIPASLSILSMDGTLLEIAVLQTLSFLLPIPPPPHTFLFVFQAIQRGTGPLFLDSMHVER